jgi:hypothetical protein
VKRTKDECESASEVEAVRAVQGEGAATRMAGEPVLPDPLFDVSAVVRTEGEDMTTTRTVATLVAVVTT